MLRNQRLRAKRNEKVPTALSLFYLAFCQRNIFVGGVFMSRAERKARRTRGKDIFKIIERNAERLNDPAFVAKLREMGLPCCPQCTTPLVMNFGGPQGDFSLCLICGAEIPARMGANA